MRRYDVVLLGVLLLISGTGVFNGCASSSTHDTSEHAAHSTAAQPTRYHCPMHPTYVADEPGNCPICQMRLVPMTAPDAAMAPADTMHEGSHAEVEGHARVTVPRDRQQLIGVTTAPVTRRMLTKTIRTVGVVAFDPELYRAQEEYIRAVAGARKVEQASMTGVLERAQRLVASSRLRLQLQGVGAAQIDALDTMTQADTSLLLGINPYARVWLYATIYENEMGLVREGQTVTVQVKAHPGEVFQGTVAGMDPVLDAQTRSVRARVAVPNPEGKLTPNMYANVRLEIPLGEQLAVPVSAVMDTGARQMVYVRTGAGRFAPRAVQLGHAAGEAVVVLAGLEEGETVVTSGNFLIDAESRLRGAAAATPEGSHSH